VTLLKHYHLLKNYEREVQKQNPRCFVKWGKGAKENPQPQCETIQKKEEKKKNMPKKILQKTRKPIKKNNEKHTKRKK